MSTTSRPVLVAAPGIRFGAANAALVVALFAGAAVRLSAAPTEALVGIVVAAASVAVAPFLGAAIGVVGWAFYTGFAEHDYGVLTLGRGDLLRLGLVVAVGMFVARSTGRSRPVAERTGVLHE